MKTSPIISRIKPTLLYDLRRGVYPFFILRIFIMGIDGIIISYAPLNSISIVVSGFFATINVILYIIIFGYEKMIWLLINSLLSLGWILSILQNYVALFEEKNLTEFPWYTHIIPATYLIIYLFLWRHIFIDILERVTNSPQKAEWIAGLTFLTTNGLLIGRSIFF